MSQNPGIERLAVEEVATGAVIDAVEHDTTTEGEPVASLDEQRGRVLRARVALVVMSLVVLSVVVLLPVAANSLLSQLSSTDVVPAYNVLTGEVLDPQRHGLAPVDATYANFDINDID